MIITFVYYKEHGTWRHAPERLKKWKQQSKQLQRKTEKRDREGEKWYAKDSILETLMYTCKDCIEMHIMFYTEINTSTLENSTKINDNTKKAKLRENIKMSFKL